jgi:CheY-like chemotaxis protein
MQAAGKRLKILVVEDSANDAQMIRTALERGGVKATLSLVGDGIEAVRYLRGEGRFRDRRLFPLPTFILSDVKMPEMDGLQFLRWVRSYPECSGVPIIMLSVSASDVEVEEAYELGANAYLLKPGSLNELTELLRTTCDFWNRCECRRGCTLNQL